MELVFHNKLGHSLLKISGMGAANCSETFKIHNQLLKSTYINIVYSMNLLVW